MRETESEMAERRAVLRAFNTLSSILPLDLPGHHHFLFIKKLVLMH